MILAVRLALIVGGTATYLVRALTGVDDASAAKARMVVNKARIVFIFSPQKLSGPAPAHSGLRTLDSVPAMTRDEDCRMIEAAPTSRLTHDR
jgi:hypothetical protein